MRNVSILGKKYCIFFAFGIDKGFMMQDVKNVLKLWNISANVFFSPQYSGYLIKFDDLTMVNKFPIYWRIHEEEMNIVQHE